jgi:predicted RNA-binding Zn-ribbon protein involved in translation (DUF1610 family)
MAMSEQCPDCEAELQLKVPAREIRSGTVGGEGGEIPRSMSSDIFECPECGAHWTKRGSRLERLGG